MAQRKEVIAAALHRHAGLEPTLVLIFSLDRGGGAQIAEIFALARDLPAGDVVEKANPPYFLTSFTETPHDRLTLIRHNAAPCVFAVHRFAGGKDIARLIASDA